MKYSEQFSTLIIEMKKHSDLSIESAKFHKPKKIGNRVLSTFNKKLRAVPQKVYKTLLPLFSNTALAWGYVNRESTIPAGEFYIRSVADIVKKEFVIWYEDMPDEEQDFLRELVVFDTHPVTGDGVKGCYRTNPESEQPEIWLIDSNGEYFLTNLSLQQYFDCLLELKGSYSWQFLFCDIQLSDDYFQFVKSDLNQLFDRFSIHFPEVNLEPYKALYQKISQS